MEHQKTIKKNITFSGIGIHKGTENKITLIPTKDNYGIKFQKEETNKTLDLDIKYINNTNRSTNIKTKNRQPCVLHNFTILIPPRAKDTLFPIISIQSHFFSVNDLCLVLRFYP